jgi:hypothetical protein
MAKIKIHTHILVPDSNVLFAKEIAQVVRDSFSENLKKCRDLATVKLCIPEVVREEIIFQKFHTACKSNENANISLKNLATVTKTHAPKPRSEAYLKSRVRAVFNEWAKANDARTVKTPYTHIKWSKLAEAAIWHRPPFSPPNENDLESEKGFRDALILETFRDICRMNPNECVVLLTNDKLLRQAAESLRLSGKVSFCDGIQEFWSSLKLLHDNRTKEFANALLANAPKAFYEQGNLNCIYYKCKIVDEVEKRFGKTLNNPQEVYFRPTPATLPGLPFGNPTVSFGNPGLPIGNPTLPLVSVPIGNNIFETITRNWKPASEEKIYIHNTNLQDTKDERTIWQTRLEFVRAFGIDGPSTGLVPVLGMDDRVRIAPIDVIWDALASEGGDLSDWKLLDIKLGSFIFAQLNAPIRTKYNFNFSRYMPLPEANNPQ